MAVEVEAVIKEIIPRTYNVKSFRLGLEKRENFKPGQYLLVTVKGITKPLSMSNSPTEQDYLEFTKKLTESEFSKALDQLKTTEGIKIKYPYGTFTFEGEHERIAFLSGGIGITPVRSICKYIVDKRLGTDVVLIYANRTKRDIAFKEDFDAMQTAYPELKVIHIISQEEEKEWSGRRGHIDSQVIKQEIPDYAERKFYLCGPPGMVQAMGDILIDGLDVDSGNIFTENFVGY